MCWIIFAVFWFVSALSTKRTAERQSLPSQLLYMIFLVLGAWLLFNGFNRPLYPLGLAILPHSSVAIGIGVVFTILGLLLALWARVTLGANWSSAVTFKEHHELVQRGPYAFVRHPIYTALLLMFLGTAIALGTLGGFIGWPLVFISVWIKLKQEEKLMMSHFPTDYPAYKYRVKALIPFIF